MQILTVKCKLKPTDEQAEILDRTLKAFAQGCNIAIEVGRENNLSNNFKIHKLCYQTIREQCHLPANLAVRAIARAAGILKIKERKYSTVKPTSADFDVRTFSFKENDWSVKLTTTDDRLHIPLGVGEYQRDLLKGAKPTSATLCKSRKGVFYLSIQVKREAPKPLENIGALGVDFGIKRIATTSQGAKWDGKQLNDTRNRFAKVRAALQRKKARKKSHNIVRLLKRLSGRERRFQLHLNHTISKAIVKTALENKQIIRLEELTGIRERAKVRKKQKRSHHSWAFYQLRQQITYKAALVGVGVELVNPAYTSQICHICKTRGRRNGLVFKCLNSNCGVLLDADINGACHIAAGGALVTRPEVSAASRER